MVAWPPGATVYAILFRSWFACAPTDANYEITLVPHFVGATRDELIAARADAKLVLTAPDGGREVFELGVSEAGATWTVPELSPLEAGTAVGLAFERPGAGQTGEWDRSATIAYGEAQIDEELGTGGRELALDVLALWVDRVTRVGQLADGKRQLGGAAAMTRGGDLFVFGGGDAEDFEVGGYGVGSDKILHAARTPDGWASGEVLEEALPASTAAAAALTVDTQRGERIFVFGGRDSLLNAGFTSRTWVEFDPAARTIVTQGELLVSRSAPIVLPVGANKIFVLGGNDPSLFQQFVSYELFAIGTRESTLSANGGQVEGNYGAFATTLGEFVAVCAGAQVDTQEPDLPLTPTDQCFVIDAEDRLSELAPLPEPLFAASIAELSDGGLLVTGGTSASLDLDAGDDTWLANAPASPRAYRWEPKTNSWSSVGDLVHPRAHHRSIGLADGRVLVIGGTDLASHRYSATGQAVSAHEVFDPVLETFAVSGTDAAGGGQDPGVVGPVGGPWAVFEGYSALVVPGPPEGGAAYGVVGGQPPL